MLVPLSSLTSFSFFHSPQVQIFLGDKDIRDLASLDAVLSDFLSLDALRSDMESFRDEIIEYYMQVRIIAFLFLVFHSFRELKCEGETCHTTFCCTRRNCRTLTILKTQDDGTGEEGEYEQAQYEEHEYAESEHKARGSNHGGQ